MEAFTLYARLVLTDEEFSQSLPAKEKSYRKWGAKLGQLAGKAFAEAWKVAKDTIEKGMDFDAMMSSVKAVTGATEEEFDKLRARALELGRTTQFTATEVAEGLYYMGLAGWEAEDSIKAIAPVLNAAAIAGEDLGSASSIVVDGMAAFGLSADKAEHYVDVLAATATNSNTTIAKMGDTFVKLAPVAHGLGMSVDDISVAIGLLANNGIKGSMAGTSLNRILVNLLNPTAKAQTAIKHLGVTLFDENNNLKSFAEILDEIRSVDLSRFAEGISEDKLEQLNALVEKYGGELSDFDVGGALEDEEIYAKYSKAISKVLHGLDSTQVGFFRDIVNLAGIRGLPAFLALMNASEESVTKLRGAIEDSEGAGAEMAGTMLDNLKGDVTILNSAIEGLQILVSDQYKGKLREFTQLLTEEVGEMSKAFSQDGLSGMFINLTNWMIDGITSTLTDPNITVEGASEFGEAFGTFIGNLIGKLVENGGAIMLGLFTAGINLSKGLIKGIVYGLFGTGDDSVAGLIKDIEKEQGDAISEAESNAAQASGIVRYMENLQTQYGEAASKTQQWADALEQLRNVMPDVADLIEKQGDSLSFTNGEIQAYIANTLETAKQQARQKAVQRMVDEYEGKVLEQASAETQRDMAAEQMEEARQRMLAIAQRLDPSYTGYDVDGSLIDAESIGNYLKEVLGVDGELKDEVDGLILAYQTAETNYNTAANDAVSLAKEADALAVQLEIAQKAFDRLAGAANGAASNIGRSGGGAIGGTSEFGFFT